ncbi:hypothetical protein BDV26DRAFT_252471 [Aspergillus bertholletiae]|uniref:Uncharacterized protein n=1 Tax=Aspergillus bertholletiae TaxID=1226010 RepID=A0A5N7BMG9_9EURO|nr:hypothetical protein BDV26DRAFT_252471 [Aspergillus bertholletiae]
MNTVVFSGNPVHGDRRNTTGQSATVIRWPVFGSGEEPEEVTVRSLNLTSSAY